VIPILFIPGVMGTRLYSTSLHKIVWDPPNGGWQKLGTYNSYKKKTTQTRITELDAPNTVVTGAVPQNLSENNLDQAHKGWNALYSSSYHPFMAYLEKTLDILHGDGGNVEPPAVAAGGVHANSPKLQMPWEFSADPKEYGGLSGNALTSEEYRFAVGEYRYEVWGGGYNWLQSNRDSADKVWPVIQRILDYYGKRKILNKAGKLIIISHSMGGLVTRALCAHPERAAKILGVISLAQPTAGAPAAYKRMRAGFEGMEATVLGRNAADVTGILGGCETGGLELLPFASYNQKQPWLLLEEAGLQNLPNGDPFNDIYQSTNKLYALMPDQNLKYLPYDKNPSLAARRTRFSTTIKDVKTFQDSIKDFPNLNKLQTRPLYAAWGAGTGGAGRNTQGYLSWERVPPVTHPLFPELAAYVKNAAKGVIDQYPAQDNGTGTVTIDRYSYSIRIIHRPGDGTVPDVSGQDIKRAAQVCFVHGEGGTGKKNQDYVWEHQDACLDPRIKWMSIYSIIKIVNTFAATELKP
jgi:pimeloyl-ACP methyl ester carboxylesterase